MTRTNESFEDKLARLGADTEGLKPRADFAQRVMAAIEAPRTIAVNADWSLQVLRWAKLGTALAGLAAATSIFFAWDNANAADQEEAVAYGMSEGFE